MSEYRRVDIGAPVRFFARKLTAARRLDSSEEFARARACIPAFCVDGLPCGYDRHGHRAIALVVRKDGSPEDGPFRNEPWVIGGKWDMMTPMNEFVRRKTIIELFGGSHDNDVKVIGPLGTELFATGWDTDGPHGLPGVTLQFCYHVEINRPIEPESFRPDGNHSNVVIVQAGRPLPALHPYILDVIQLSEWLR